MWDLLTTCYSDYITVSRPQTLISSFNNSDEEGEEERTEREPSPIHLSSALSTSSRVTCFSQRLAQLDKKQNDKNIKPILGHRRINQNQFSSAREINNDKQNSIIDSDTISSIPSIDDSSKIYFNKKYKNDFENYRYFISIWSWTWFYLQINFFFIFFLLFFSFSFMYIYF